MKRLALRSIRTKLLLAFAVLALGPLITLGILATREGRKELEEAATGELQQYAEGAASAVSAYLDERVGDAAVFTAGVAARGPAEEVGHFADHLVAIYGEYDAIVVTDAEGKVLATNSTTGDGKPVDRTAFAGKSMRGQAWFDQIANNQVARGASYVGDAELDPVIAQITHGRGQGFVTAIGIYDDAGKLLRVWSNHVSWERSIAPIISRELARAKRLGVETSQFELVNKAGLVIHDEEDAARMMKVDLSTMGLAYVTRALAGEAGSMHAVDPLDNNEDLIGFAPVAERGDYKSAGWAVFMHQTYAEVAGETKGLRNFALVIVGAALLFVVLGAFLVSRSISRPMAGSVATLRRVADGDLTARATVTTADEVGQMGEALNQALDRVGTAFSTIASGVIELSQSASELSSIGNSLGANADETSRQAGVVAAASEQAGKNVQTVAAGTEEMSVTIKEIAKNAAAAARVATSAVGSAQRTNELVGKLGDSSAEIGNVLKVITTIAEQTNLLALNATIEAARAGEAGKGFAVVANEVKELAKETAKATEDITRKISAIQADTTSAIDAIAEITKVIGEINDIQNTIASSVEEQAATTNEIGRNIHELAQASNEIAQNVTSVAASAGSTADASTHTRSAAANLTELSTKLDAQVRQFHVDEGRPAASSRGTVVTPPPGVHISQPIPVVMGHARRSSNGRVHH